MNNYQIEILIVTAIKLRKTITFDYKEPHAYVRTIRVGNPHAIFEHKKTHNILVDIYQIDGQSTDRYKIPGWRMFDIENISNLRIIEDSNFLVQNDYNSFSSKYISCIAKI